ncbi:N-acetylglucosamine 6-phosphate deacetylase [Coriobacterium glomerans PW2]|uniref:N-acetylglucosamine-6-phosphate deacetylase n=1 Tax=Coriobacterium glomerans (strain ATCC 49209 / DSM 20642 / JCM 10262 / PW2) TaxID=700015 RepID=F2NAK1_CORGP|nr:N-acetylglucosamine-6-phosphate deacetylase [Coriobacterium glomerans]AEB06528.1 N-acetylglucosamine 6-phosphate deacetylase [Coriobacterium glomerans PW2]
MGRYAVLADRFYFPTHTLDGGYLLVEDGMFGEHVEKEPDCEILDRRGCHVAPGFVDTHIHGYGDCDVMDGTWDSVHTIAKRILENGVTSWLPTTLTATAEQLDAACHGVADRIDENTGARIQGIFLEGPFFTEKHKGAQNPAYLSAPAIEKLKRWQSSAKGLVKKIAIAAEFPDSPAFIRAAREMGVVVALGHSDAGVSDALHCLDAGARVFVHTYNGMSPLHHREPGMVGAALYSGHRTYSELICDGHHVNPIAASIVMQCKGHDHCVLITDCMRAGGMPDGDYLLGELPVVVAGGTARLKDAGSLAGSILRLNDAVKHVVAWGIATPAQAIDMATRVAAEANEIGDVCGSIQAGRAADFVVLEPDLTLSETFLGGKSVYRR